MTDAQIYRYATTMTEDLFMMSVTGIADEYDSDNWDAVNAAMRDLYRACNKTMKEIRNSTGLTQGAFAELINSNKRTVEDWEYGKRNPTDTVKFLILQYLGLFKRNIKEKMKDINVKAYQTNFDIFIGENVYYIDVDGLEFDSYDEADDYLEEIIFDKINEKLTKEEIEKIMDQMRAYIYSRVK